MEGMPKITRHRPSLLGGEFEAAVTARCPDGSMASPEGAIDHFYRAAKERLPHIADLHSGGLFLANGGLIYRDSGVFDEDSLEWASPECSNPTDAVRFLRAGESIMCQLGKDLVEGGRLAEAGVFRHCSNYGTLGNLSKGAHENYLYRGKRRRLELTLVPFLLSRQIFSGAGGFDSRHPGARFLLSPRTTHLEEVVSSSTLRRSILNFKDESLCAKRGSIRVHLICGESNIGDFSCYLKFATTAVVLAMIRAKFKSNPGIWFWDGVKAMKSISGDPGLETRLRTTQDEFPSALELQEMFLEAAESRIGETAMPAFTEEVCLRWREALHALGSRTSACSDESPETIDWKFKFRLFSDLIERRGFSWEEIEDHNEGAVAAFEATRTYPVDTGCFRRKARPILDRNGLNWSRFSEFLNLRDELQALDVKLSEIAEGSLLSRLVGLGAFDHQIDDVTPESVRVARDNPPEGTRASVRGKIVRKHAADPSGGFYCSWQAIVDVFGERQMDLDDPFQSTAPPWFPVGPQISESRSHRYRFPESRLPEILRYYDEGDYRRARRMLRSIEDDIPPTAELNELPYTFLRYQAWIAGKLGDLDEARSALECLRTAYPRIGLGLACDFVNTLGSLGFVGDDAIEEWVDAGLALGSRGRGNSDELCPFYTNAALRRLRLGEVDAAWNLLDQAQSAPAITGAHPHTIARMFALLAECARLMGFDDEAGVRLEQVENLYRQGRFQGDYAEFCLLGKARLARDRGSRAEAVEFIVEALSIQSALGLPSEIRSYVLLARILGEPELGPLIRRRRHRFSALAKCKHLNRLLEPDRWKTWCRSEEGLHEPWMRAI